MPALTVDPADIARRHDCDTGESIGQCRLSSARRTEKDERPARIEIGTDGVGPVAGLRVNCQHIHPRRGCQHLGSHAVRIRHEVGLGENHEWLRAAPPREHEQPLDTADLGLGIQMLDDDHQVDVRC